MKRIKEWWNKPLDEIVDSVYIKRYAIKALLYSLGILVISGIIYYINSIITNNKTTDTAVNASTTQVGVFGLMTNIPIMPLLFVVPLMVISTFFNVEFMWAIVIGLQLFLFVTLGLSFWTFIFPISIVFIYYFIHNVLTFKDLEG